MSTFTFPSRILDSEYPKMFGAVAVTINGNSAYDGGGQVPAWWHPSHSFDVVYLN